MNMEGSQFNVHHTNENKQKLFIHTPVILRESGTITFYWARASKTGRKLSGKAF